MKKVLLLIPVLALSLMASAKEIEIGSATSNILGVTVNGSGSVDGDVIILTDNGPYVNVKGSDDYTKLEKNLTIKAAEGVNPVIQYEVPFRSKLGKTVKFIGITFDGTSLTGYDFYFRFYDANNNNLEFENCEFKNISKYVFDVYTAHKANSLKLTNCKLHDNSSRGILNRGTLTNLEINGGQIYNFTGYPVLDNYDGATLGKIKINGTEFYGNAKDIINGTPTSHADSCIINNCYFHNNSRSAVYFQESSVSGVETCDGVIVKNSTFANNDLSASSRSVIEVQNYGGTETANIEVNVDHCTFYNNTTVNYDYSCIRSRKSTKVSITNSIFAYPTAIDFYATNCYGGTISNTIVYNLNNGHRKSGGNPAVTNTITDNPLFNDLANNKYTYAGNWSTGSVSPAREASADGSDLGDPRWYSAEVLPSVDFASPYQFVGAKALLSGKIWYDSENGYLYGDGGSNKEYGTATWKFHAEKACVVEIAVNLNSGNTSGHKLRVEVIDSDGNSIGEFSEQTSTLPSTLTIPAVGDYKIILHDDQTWSSAKIDNVTLTYIGGDVQTMPGTTDIDDAWFSSNGTRAAGEYISIPAGHQDEGWVKWNVAFASAGSYNVIVNIDNSNGHNYTVALYTDEDDETPITIGEGGQKSTIGTINLGRMSVPAGNYILKVTNATTWSDAKLVSVQFAYAGGATIDVPSTLLPEDAILSSEAWIDNDSILFTARGSEGHNTLNWAKWNIRVENRGFYNFTAHVCRPNGSQKYEIKVLNSDESSEVFTYTDESIPTGDQTTSTGARELTAGNYVVKVRNTYDYAESRLLKVVVERGTITIDEAANSETTNLGEYDTYTVNAHLVRTLVGGMYNTICLPFAVSAAEKARVFGSAKVKELTDSSIESDGFVLNLNFTEVNEMAAGVPYLIKPAANIENPTFLGVTIANTLNNSETDVADFIGNFVVSEVPEGRNNYFLSADNKLYYSNSATAINGMRGYFALKNISGSAPTRACIVEAENVVTEIDIVNGEMPETFTNTGKLIENGQLIVVRDGIRYNALGVKIK